MSDQFGGCEYTILRNPAGALFAAHVFIDVGKTQFHDSLAHPPHGWDNLGTWQSSVNANRWNFPTLLAIAFFERNQVTVVAVGARGYPAKIESVSIAKTFRF
jgi:hypothetical protein